MSSTSLEPPTPPIGVGLSGIIFSALFVASLVLIRFAVPADPADPGLWLTDPVLRKWVQTALTLIPFTGIAFLWFMGVVRNRIGLLEDRFFATLFLGSGLLFVAMLLASGAVAGGLLVRFGSNIAPSESETYRVLRAAVYVLFHVYGIKMAAVFMFATSTIGLRTGALATWLSFTGFILGLVLLLVIGEFAWIALLFPFWVLLVSVWILITDLQSRNHTASPRGRTEC